MADTTTTTPPTLDAVLMNLPVNRDKWSSASQQGGVAAYALGHRDARHAAVEAVSPIVTALERRALAAEAKLAEAKEPVRKALAQLMSDVSEEYWCAGWNHGLEYTLWAAVCGDAPGSFPDCVENLRVLSDLAGGWFRWSDADDDEQFIEKAEWLEVYAAWKTPQRVADVPIQERANLRPLARESERT